MVDSLKALLKSRKFLLMVLDVVLSTVLYFVGNYGGAEMLENVKFLITSYQPVFVVIIGAIAYEDAHK